MVKLKEYLYPEMDILFVALNAPEVSNANAHWFSRNLSFWNVLFRAGLIIEPILNPTEGDQRIFGNADINFQKQIYGVTDLNNELVETHSKNVTIEERHLDRIRKIIERNKVRKLCLMHALVGQEFREAGLVERSTGQRYGLIGYYKATQVYEVPFHNASIPNKEQYYRLLIEPKIQRNEPTKKPCLAIPKESYINKRSFKTVASFIIPSANNSITKSDLDKGTLRITIDFKSWFPSNDANIKIEFNKGNSSVKN